jgi:uncharacterized Zn finger protein
MRRSKCISCGQSSGFELAVQAVRGAEFQYGLLQCSNCGAVVGLVEDQNVSAQISQLRESVKKTLLMYNMVFVD